MRARWLPVPAAMAVLVACSDGAPLERPSRVENRWAAMIEGTALADLTEVDSARAARLVDSIAPLAATDSVARAGLLVAISRHPNQRIGASAAQHLARLGAPAVAPLRLILQSPNSSVQLRAAYGLGEVGPAAKASAPELARLLREGNDTLASMASWALRKVAPRLKDPVVDLFRALRFETGYTRNKAMYDAGIMGPAATEAFPLLVQLLADTSAEVRQVAADALVQAGAAARAAVERGLQSGNDQIRVESMLILSRLSRSP